MQATGAVWKVTGFMSTTSDVNIAKKYAGCRGPINIMNFNLGTDQAKRAKLGKWISKCSAYPEEEEFLVAQGNCFKVTKVTFNEINACKDPAGVD